MTSRASRPEPRAEAPTAFSAVLGAARRASGARAVALVDDQGETVDWIARGVSAFDVKVAAAHVQLLAGEASAALAPSCGPLVSVSIRARRLTFVAHALHDGYLVVFVLGRGRPGVSALVVEQLRHEIAREAGWPPPARALEWHPAHVRSHGGPKHRPHSVKVGGAFAEVDVLGRGGDGVWRVRAGGVETTLRREAGGVWWSDAALDDLAAVAPRARTRNSSAELDSGTDVRGRS